MTIGTKLHPPAIILFFVLLLATGCDSRAIVKGKVSYKNAALSTGQVHFFGETGTSRSAAIGADGTYEVSDCPIGKVRVAVVATTFKSKGPAPVGPDFIPNFDAPPAEEVSLIPKKYNTPETSDLNLNVSAGRQAFNINLVD